MSATERVAFFNGQFLPESQVRIPLRDDGFLHGDAVFDTARTFHGRLFKLREHLERLSRSLRYLRLDPGMSVEQFEEVTQEVVRRNLPLLGPNEDYWVTQRVTRGEPGQGPGVIVECRPLPLRQRARYFRDGIPVVTPSVRRTPPWAQSPQAKTHNYLNMVLGDLEAKAQNPDAWAVLLDEDGNLAEGLGSNIFLVREGQLLTPRVRTVLPGVTRQTVLELARGLGLEAREQDVDLFDAYTAEEAFLTSTSLCVCPVASINGQAPLEGRVPGPVTRRLMAAFTDLVGVDYVAQYLAHLER